MSFGVIGAGVVGLTTALELQKTFPNAQINLFADKFGVDTTSDVAAGIFRPAPSFSGPNEKITRFVFIDFFVSLQLVRSYSKIFICWSPYRGRKILTVFVCFYVHYYLFFVAKNRRNSIMYNKHGISCRIID